MYPENKATVFVLGDVLDEAGVRDTQSIEDTGAIIEIRVTWDCASDGSCEPDYQFERVDADDTESPILFEYLLYRRTAHYYSEQGELRRDYTVFTGLKIIISSHGVVHQFSFQLFVLQIASMMALFRLTNAISDFILLNYPNKEKREEFRQMKMVDSVDFSDKRDKIDLIRFLANSRGLEENQEEEEST